ncbi:MAG: hypothetical protein MjAS7_1651 [Metallosphaera javensis (ex Sakai et al. 2022)]|nr:MAG: hypothetical protein MjAS7_1651 [Metallosphaera javensis (ex Sakai et al. 2022)]
MIRKAVFVDTNVIISWLFEPGNTNFSLANKVIECVKWEGRETQGSREDQCRTGYDDFRSLLMTFRILTDNLGADWDSLTLSIHFLAVPIHI